MRRDLFKILDYSAFFGAASALTAFAFLAFSTFTSFVFSSFIFEEHFIFPSFIVWLDFSSLTLASFEVSLFLQCIILQEERLETRTTLAIANVADFRNLDLLGIFLINLDW